MANPFLGQLMLVGFDFAPTQWAFCAGQLLPISQNTALFSLLGTTYGGDGRSNFGLPNLQGSCAIGSGQGPGLSIYDLGEIGGSSSVTLLVSEVPNHNHQPMAKESFATETAPLNNSFAEASGGNIYSTSTSNLTAMAGTMTNTVGNSLAHNNQMPYLTLNWIIALAGVFPARS
jgi:microcystin-dependent protein